MAKFITFYSFKGGVGRTLAMANVAWALAERGKRVVAIDMDFEAPSLQGIREFSTQVDERALGMLDFAAHFARDGQLPAIDKFVHQIPDIQGRGALWLMPAGSRSPHYAQSLAELNWSRLHAEVSNQDFVEGLRGQLQDTLKADYVLIDSRTGLSDVGGFSTHLLADMVVLVFNLTRYCLRDTVAVYQSIISAKPQMQIFLIASPVPPGDNARIAQRLEYARKNMPYGIDNGRSIYQVRYDPAMVLADELAVCIPERLQAADVYKTLLADLRSANPDEVFGVVQEVVALRKQGQVEQGLERLKSFTAANQGDADGWLALGQLYFELGRPEAIPAFKSATELLPKDFDACWKLGQALVANNRLKEALATYERAQELGAHSSDFFSQLANLYDAKKEPDKVFAAHAAAVRAAIPDGEVPPTKVTSRVMLRRIWDRWFERRLPYAGFDSDMFWNALMGSLSLSEAKKAHAFHAIITGKMEPVEFRELEHAFNEELESLQGNLGPNIVVLRQRIADSGVNTDDPDALKSLLNGEPGDLELINFLLGKPTLSHRWALAEKTLKKYPENLPLVWITRQVILDEYQNSIISFDEAQTRLEGIVTGLGVPHAEQVGALYNLGIAFSALADAAEDLKQIRICRDRAIALYKLSFAVRPMGRILDNWVAELLHLTDMDGVTADEQSEWLEQAESLMHQAADIQDVPVETLYNYACIRARKQAPDALSCLRQSLLGPGSAHVRNDPDWAAYLDNPEFHAILAEFE